MSAFPSCNVRRLAEHTDYLACNRQNLFGQSAKLQEVPIAVSMYLLEELLETQANLFVDICRDALHAATTSKTADVGLCDALDVVPEDLATRMSVVDVAYRR